MKYFIFVEVHRTTMHEITNRYPGIELMKLESIELFFKYYIQLLNARFFVHKLQSIIKNDNMLFVVN